MRLVYRVGAGFGLRALGLRRKLRIVKMDIEIESLEN
jgi:hypothetical protein